MVNNLGDINAKIEQTLYANPIIKSIESSSSMAKTKENYRTSGSGSHENMTSRATKLRPNKSVEALKKPVYLPSKVRLFIYVCENKCFRMI